MNIQQLASIVSLFTTFSAHANEGVVVEHQTTRYGAKVNIAYEKAVHNVGGVSIGYAHRWVQKTECSVQGNGKITASVNISYELNSCNPGFQCQIDTFASANKTFRIRSKDLCEEGVPTFIFVNGTQVL